MSNDYMLDLGACPEELNAVLHILREQNDQESRWPNDSNIDWQQFLQYVQHHRVYPTVHACLASGSGESAVPAAVMQALRAQFTRNTFQMLHLSAEMERVCSSLQERLIRTLTLKGPVLSHELYGDLSLRTSKDLDILVPIDDVERAEEILAGLGYVIQDNPIRVLDWKWKLYHISYFHPEKRVEIELHWTLNPDMSRKEPSFAELWERRRTSSLGSGSVYYLSTEHLFMYLVCHGSRHGWFRLRWLQDIDRLVRAGLNPAELHALLSRYECLHIGGQALILASQLLGTPVTDELRSLFFGRRQHRLAQSALLFIHTLVQLCPDPPPAMAKPFRIYLFSLKSRRQRWAYRINRLYPSSKDAEMLPLPRALHVLYFPLRPFLWCMRQWKRQSSLMEEK